MDPSDVTLIIPCYNAASTLPEALDAVDALDPGPASVVCIDDGSGDRTNEIIAAHSGATLVAHERNRGIGAALNTGLSHTDTPYLAKIDADIVVPPDWLEHMLAAIERTGASFVQGRFAEDVTTYADQWRKFHPSPSFSYSPEWNHPVNGATIVAHTGALRAIGGWDEQYRRSFDDIDVMQRLISDGGHVYYTPRAHATHIRTDSMMEVLGLSWAYANEPNAGGAPTSIYDLPTRLKAHAGRLGKGVLRDIYHGRPHHLLLTVVQAPVHLKWDIDHIREASTETLDSSRSHHHED